MKTDELVISEDYRYYVTREGKIAVLMCDLTNVPVDVPFEEMERDSLVFLHEQLGLIDPEDKEFPLPIFSHYKNGMWASVREDRKDIVGCLYFAGGYQEAKLELQANLFRKFVCCDDSDVVVAVYYPKTGMASTFGVVNGKKSVSLSGPSHLLARSIAESIARGDGKWLEATWQSLQSRREAVQRHIDEREEFPQYWTTNSTISDQVAYVIKTGAGDHDWQIARRDGSIVPCKFMWNANGRTRLTKEQAEALLDKKTCDVDWVTQDVVPVRVGIDEVAWFWHDTQKLGPWDRAAGVWGEHVHGDVISNATLHVRCRRKDLPMKDKNIEKIAPPTNEQLFEMVANLRDQMDQMDHLNRKIEQMCGKMA